MARLKYLSFPNETLLKDALHNLADGTGATLEYRIGMVVGVVATLNAAGLTFKQAIDTVACYMPDGGHLACPGSWAVYLQLALMSRGKTWISPI